MEKDVSVARGNGRRVQVRKARKDGFGEAKKQVFLDHLAACCTVKRAAAAAGVSTVTVNYHRRSDPVFDQRCADALEVGYGNLEASMLERAAKGGAYSPGPEADAAPGPETVDTELGIRLLQLRRRPMGQRTGKAGYAPRTVSPAALNESILAKLEVLHRRLNLKRHEVRKLKSPGDVALRQARDERAVADKGRKGRPSTGSGRTVVKGKARKGKMRIADR